MSTQQKSKIGRLAFLIFLKASHPEQLLRQLSFSICESCLGEFRRAPAAFLCCKSIHRGSCRSKNNPSSKKSPLPGTPPGSSRRKCTAACLSQILSALFPHCLLPARPRDRAE